MIPKKVCFICSPYAGNIKNNLRIAEKMTKRAIELGYAPITTCFIYPRVLNDADSKQRKLGIDCGLSILKKCDLMLVYKKHGVSKGMKIEIEYAINNKTPIINIDFS